MTPEEYKKTNCSSCTSVVTSMAKISVDEIPWKDPIKENKVFWVFKDKYPVTEGHLLFVPKKPTMPSLTTCFRAAWLEGLNQVDNGKCTGYNIGQNNGKDAGQTIMYPHIHLIPRNEGDLGRYENGTPYDPTGGVRNIFPGKGKY